MNATKLNPTLLKILENDTKPFRELMMHYECAIIEIKTKLDVLNKELSMIDDRNPFDTITTRLKTPKSIMEKLNRLKLTFTLENVENELTDVAGVRVICSFIEDIYKVSQFIKSQDDIIVLSEKDYIKNPKDNGYRSLHIVVSIPIFLSNQKKNVKVEIQFRTIAMDFWASLEHKMKYKKEIIDFELITEELKNCADSITAIDQKMSKIRTVIEGK